MTKQYFIILTCILSFLGCDPTIAGKNKNKSVELKQINSFDSLYKTIHVFVALCDNQFQGIVPVPAKIGNGQDPSNNLYWGCGFGVRTYFKNSKEWKLIKSQKIDNIRLERLVFKHINQKYYLIADAYNGKYIKQCTKEFLYSCSGQVKDTLQLNNTIIGINGNARLISYVGHNGLMDFQLNESFENKDEKNRDCIILACKSKDYFKSYLKEAMTTPVIWTTGLMSPEAYTLHDALSGYIKGESNESIRTKAALAYAKYQKCGEKAARNLIVTGW